MKNIIFTFAFLCILALNSFAQFPHAINFQAIARDANGDVMISTPIQIRLTIIDGSATGTEVYQELRALTTNSYGSFSFQIGRDANYVTIGTFDAIDWNTGNKFLKIDYDPTNQFNWALTLGTIEFVAVPFALSAETVSFIDATNAQDGDVLVYNSTTGMFEPQQIAGTNYTAGTGISISGTAITNIGDLSNTNEIELPTQSGNSGKFLSTNGTLPSWTTALMTEVDGSITNEIQTLSLNTNTLSLSNGGGSVTLPSGGTSQWISDANGIKYFSGNVVVGSENSTSPYLDQRLFLIDATNTNKQAFRVMSNYDDVVQIQGYYDNNFYNSGGEGVLFSLIKGLTTDDFTAFRSGIDANDNLFLGVQSNTLYDYHLFTFTNSGSLSIGDANPTSKLQVVGLPEYADNAAALAAGLTVGAFYRTGDILKVVH